MRLLIQSVNNGRYTPDVKLRTGNITDNLGMYLAMAMKKNGNINEYQRYQKAINEKLNKFDIRTWEDPSEIDVIERIKLKALQKEMNDLDEE